MKPKDAAYLHSVVENEGFAYAFLHYSDFSSIEDEEFQILRNRFEESANELAEYLGVNI